jgi:hypothetical protein
VTQEITFPVITNLTEAGHIEPEVRRNIDVRGHPKLSDP